VLLALPLIITIHVVRRRFVLWISEVYIYIGNSRMYSMLTCYLLVDHTMQCSDQPAKTDNLQKNVLTVFLQM